MRARQLDLLNDWAPVEPTVRFAAERVRAASFSSHLARSIAAALADCPASRVEIANKMTAFLGQTVTKNMLDAYASEARQDHVISLPRFAALLHATQDRRLLETIAEQFGWTVIDKRHAPLIQLAQVQERADELRQTVKSLRRQARAAGTL